MILSEYNLMNIFVYADMKSKIARCKMKSEEQNLNDKELEKKIKDIDNKRKAFHNIIRPNEWGKKENYDLCINTSELDIKSIIPPLSNYIEIYFRRIRK